MGSTGAFPFPRLVLLLLLECAHELPPFLPPTEAANGSACACPCERLLLPSAAEMRCPSCGSGPDLVLIRLSPSEDARIGDSVAVDALLPASLSCPFLPSLAELDLAEDAALLGVAAAATDEEPKSLSRFLEVSDLVFFLSDLEEEAGEAAEAEPGAEVGVRGLLLPSGLEDSEDLCRDEKKRPLNTIVPARAPARPARLAGEEFRRTGGGGGEAKRTGEGGTARRKWSKQRLASGAGADDEPSREVRPASRGVRFASADGWRWTAGLRAERAAAATARSNRVLSGSSKLAAVGQLWWTDAWGGPAAV
jgi:hypothetical protein